MLKELIKERAGLFSESIRENRRYLHAHPELSFNENQTAKFIAQQLKELDIESRSIAGTGLLAVLKGTKGEKTENVIALRADMDALEITELNDFSYASCNKGVMHACGHDAHMAMLLGVIKILHSLKNEFGGTIKFLFQPAEEKLPGGAVRMIEEGALKDPAPQLVIGQHVRPDIPVGKVGILKGSCMASMDEIRVTINGKGGHAAQPDALIDPVVIAATIVTTLQQIVSRQAKPQTPSVLSFGKFIADGAINIIPDSVYLEGTFRTFDESWRYEAHRRMKQLAESLASGMGASCDFYIRPGYPSLYNNETATEEVTNAIKEYLGHENVLPVERWMAAEDFAYYSHQHPSVFYFLGVGNEAKGITSPLHSPTFTIDEDALETGAGLMAYLAIKKLTAE